MHTHSATRTLLLWPHELGTFLYIYEANSMENSQKILATLITILIHKVHLDKLNRYHFQLTGTIENFIIVKHKTKTIVMVSGE